MNAGDVVGWVGGRPMTALENTLQIAAIRSQQQAGTGAGEGRATAGDGTDAAQPASHRFRDRVDFSPEARQSAEDRGRSDVMGGIRERMREHEAHGHKATGDNIATANPDGESVTIHGKNGDKLVARGGKLYDEQGNEVGSYGDSGTKDTANVYDKDGKLIGTVKVTKYGDGNQAVLDASWDDSNSVSAYW